ncbi:MAG: ABC transporter ATP-binding protein [Candidatus Omnitrophica bacterium]|nr:ABC transporter ATP-binding protein [Candidatus Omnitrophota bacterium]
MINIKGLSLTYNSRFRLSIESLHIEDGKIFTIIGPNGAGKTTLLNIIGLFEKPQAQKFEVLGYDVLKGRDILFLRRMMSVVFSQPYLLNETVSSNIALPLRLRGIRDFSKVEKMCNFFKITHLKDQNAKKISQGEMHRVALARAFVTEPRLVLMDEPFSSLDPRYKETLINDLRTIIKLNKTGVIFVTQDRFEALSLSDEMAVMKDGRILQHGSPAEVFNRPLCKEVADFVGIETIVEGRIVKKEDNLCHIKVNNKILEAISDFSVGENVFVCIRPEDITISKHVETTSARNCFKAKIIRNEPWMLEYKLTLDCDFNLVSFVTKQSVYDLNLEPAKDVYVSFKATAIHLIKR